MALLRNLFGISSLTFLSRTTGLIRDVLVARTFGASDFTDIFYIAFRLPNLFRRLFAEGAFTQAFVPILAQTKRQRGPDVALKFAHLSASGLFWVLAFFSVAGVFFAPALVRLIASGLAPDSSAYFHAVNMTRIMFPYIFFMSMVAVMSAVLNTWGEYRHPAFVPTLLNISFIGCLIGLAPIFNPPIYALSVGVVLGGILQFYWLLAPMKARGLTLNFSLSPAEVFRHYAVRRMLNNIVPVLFAVSVAQVSLFINTNIASHLQSGSVTWLNFADRVMEFPTALIGVALSTLLLPKLSAATAIDYGRYLDWGIRLVLLLALPASIAMATLAEPITALLFHYGRFQAEDVRQTARAMIGYSLGLWALILLKIFVSAFFARRDTKTPVIAAIIALVVTQLFNLLSVPIWQHAGLALSISVGAIVNCGILFLVLYRQGHYRSDTNWLLFWLRLVIVTIAFAGFTAYLADLAPWLEINRLWRVLWVLGVCIGAAGLYFVALFVVGFRRHDFILKESPA